MNECTLRVTHVGLISFFHRCKNLLVFIGTILQTFIKKLKKKKLKTEIKFECYFKNYLATKPYNSKIQILTMMTILSVKSKKKQAKLFFIHPFAINNLSDKQLLKIHHT